MVQLDTILTSAGVVHAYMENEDNIMTIERNGRLLDVKAGWANISFSYHGMPFRWAIDPFIESKKLYVIKLGESNIKEYLPPKLPGAGHGGEFGDVEFAGPVGGASGIWLHERIATAGTLTPYSTVAAIGDNLEAPYWHIREVSPEYMQSIKYGDYDESY
jgi:hypothetical protein